ncbi:MBL fold metallo-hydrolase [Stakelama saccharophila]|uniref:MBL fold metallo-hydrolase n=1 Tax=Stakelama saccharophila TaxID=3075605 RepID=A0ABZ0BBC5_9SPHN|nr:MBL fold metallo-hydrolase [Stakelama sp. W311]WNO54376.1 MBL fold metallo-hydrolase [Stakelama sp. W311]
MRAQVAAIHICKACGTAYRESAAPPERCPICEDERQFVPPGGQSWTTPDAVVRGHANAWRRHEPGLFELRTRPSFAIGQRAFLVRTPAGNVLWDCLTLLDDATREIVAALGGLSAIAISHPHYYSTMQDWAEAFDCPIHLHAADRQWMMRAHPAIRFWDGDRLELLPDLTVLRLGGHFPGGCVLHWGKGADGADALLSGDIVQVTPGRDRVSFLWSYPNMMPLSAGSVRRIAHMLAPWRFERIYGAFAGREVLADGNGVVARSAARYVELLEGEQP